MSELRVNNVIAEGGTSAPNLAYGAQVPTGMGITGAGGINVTGVVTATSFSGSGANLTGVADTGRIDSASLTVSGIATFNGVGNFDAEVTAAGGVDIEGGVDVAGITTLGGQTRFTAVSEQLKRVDGNTASITWNSSGQNIGLCTNPSGDITLSVEGIPVDSNFNNQVLTFSVIVQQAGTGRTCNAVKLNGVTKTVRWSGNVPGTAGVAGTIRGYDIFNFTGINTTGSATSTTAYEVLGLVNGDFRTHA